ncbi:CoA transferase subunit A [Geotoga petraea]|uniref:CoA transferase subunit A n=1 Tax=Geotoga petraea TaxID=28234 RepID=A0A4Z0W708_9BACT|nr:CoA transferase subunit A [Geotoga petraea]TGG88924.1 CoA transferase subunit A [Geotoga petraea]
MEVINLKKVGDLITSNSSLMIGGFLGVGTPENIIDEIIRQKKEGLIVIGNDTSFVDKGIGKLIAKRLVKKVITSHIGTNPETQKQMIANECEVELTPQGTLAEKIRAAGVGLGGIFTPTGVGTTVEDGKEVRNIDGINYLFEKPLSADFALLKAKRADFKGNLQYNLTARNFNPIMALAGKTVIVEVEEIVPVGSIEPNNVHTPGVLVDYIVVGGNK